MDKNGSSLSPHNGGIYRNLMMPGFTDAGAGTSYMTKRVIPRRTEAASMAAKVPTSAVSLNVVDTDALNDDDYNNNNNNKDHCNDVGTPFEDTFSEAVTEVHDNRTSNNTVDSTTHRDRYYTLKSSVIQDNIPSGKEYEDSDKISTNKTNNNDSTDQSNNNSSGNGIEVEATFGFFPSTKPPPSPSIHGIGSALNASECRVDSSEKFTRTPKSSTKITTTSQSPCLQPISPPPVTRKQLVAVKQSPSTAAIIEDKINLPSAVSTKLTTKTLSTNSRDHRKIESEISNVIDRKNYYQVGKTIDEPFQPSSGTESEGYEHDISTEQDHAKTRQRQRPLCERPFETSKLMRREVSSFSLAPETGAVVNFEKNRIESKQEDEREDRNESGNHAKHEETKLQSEQNLSKIIDMEEGPNDNNIDDNNAGSSNSDGGITRRLDLKALQEIDNMESQKTTKTQYLGNIYQIGNGNKTKSEKVYGHDGTVDKNKDTYDPDDEGSEELSTSSSIVSSTCSEFGTVIQMGDTAMAARIKDVEEMELAALADLPIEDSNDIHETKVSQLSSSSLIQHDASLDLPILELPPSGPIDTILTKAHKMDAGQHLKDTNTTVATANSTISPRKGKPTKSEMVSAAFRRIGPIHSLNNNTVRGEKKIRNSISAPTTPMRFPTRKDKKQTLDASIEDRKSSPTRYETASDIAGDPKNRILSPRFTSFLRGRVNSEAPSSLLASDSTNEPKAASRSTPLSPRIAIAQTFQYAQKYFSQNNSVTEYPVDGDGDGDYTDFKEENGCIDHRHRNFQEHLVIPPLGQRPTTSRLAPRVLPLESSSTIRNRRTLRHSNSVDYSNSKRSLFRELPPYSTQRRHLLSHSFPASANAVPSVATLDPESININLIGQINSNFSPKKLSNKTLALNSTMELQQPQRVDIEREDALDILACLVEQGIADWNASNTNAASSINAYNHSEPKKVGNSSIAHEESTNEAISSFSSSSSPLMRTDILRAEKEEKTEEGTCQLTPAAKRQMDFNDSNHDHYDSESALNDLIEDFKKWVEDRDEDHSPNSDDEKRSQRQRRADTLQDLVRSREYAVEMKRASASASCWLKSIGRRQSTGKPEITGDNERIGKDEHIRNSTNNLGNKQSDSTNKMEILTMKATLRRSQSELTAMKEMNSMLNEELSKCRAEIGRMKSITRSDNLNKSIFDDSERSSDTSSSEARLKELSAETVSKSPGEDRTKGVSKKDLGYELFSKGVPSKEGKERMNPVDELDVIPLKNALEKANETIRRLHGDLCEKNIVGDGDGEDTDPAPVIDIPDIHPKPTRCQSRISTPDSTRRTVNVQLLDGENFVTDWNDMKDLPPPPDHSLESPIVSAVLEQWTQDRSLHEALLSWINNVMKGDDLETLPPLKISSLDHQVRDGITMHILPHLLRRADIHVAVQTRAHRQTTYDMSVTVSQKRDFTMELSKVKSSSTGNLLPKDIKSQQQLSLLDRRDSLSGDEWVSRFEPKLSSTESVAHSAVTDTIANLPTTTRNPPGAMSDLWDRPPHTPVRTEYSDFSSQLRSRSGSADNLDDNSQLHKQRHNELNQGVASGGTLMGALGGALSGLLSRNKYAVSPGIFHPTSHQSPYRAVGSGNDNRESSNILPASLRAQMDLTSSPTPGSTGHHRLGQLEATVSDVVDDEYNYHHGEPHPYHRVVSAPPGRIGVTFVEFRGHAMVSDVAMDSPLAGWVFPSDILIAVDEIPVSGMRVRDIVTILSDRKNRQRAMRVISSHAMNEFTMMNQAGSLLTEELGEGE
mmetsp:Transcript_7523/g.18505  ORF Transcript_7523/g.18505 Transcript_7523/m.18505 type:complete len:1781 (-) Transcript_7523:305-5647(-)